MLTFDADGHIYKLDGTILPSVTEVLEDTGLIDYSGVPEDARRRAQERGRLVHEAVHADLENDLDESSVPVEIQGFVEASRKARAALHIEPSLVEHLAYNPSMLYAGTPDLLCRAVIKGRSVRVVLDWKTGTAEGWVRYQLAAYASFFPSPGSYTRLCVELHVDGTYQVHPFKVAEFLRDWNVFQAALTVYRAKRESRRLS